MFWDGMLRDPNLFCHIALNCILMGICYASIPIDSSNQSIRKDREEKDFTKEEKVLKSFTPKITNNPEMHSDSVACKHHVCIAEGIIIFGD